MAWPERSGSFVRVIVFTRKCSDPGVLLPIFLFKILFDMMQLLGCQASSRSPQALSWASAGHGPTAGIRLSCGTL